MRVGGVEVEPLLYSRLDEDGGAPWENALDFLLMASFSALRQIGLRRTRRPCIFQENTVNIV
jgi:hypothetical protein